MKILNTVQNLWDYCLFCPICQKNVREIKINVGPSGVFKLSSFEKKDSRLIITCAAQLKSNNFKCQYDIDCVNNNFQFLVQEVLSINPEPISDRASSPYFYFYLYGNCKECGMSYLNSKDLELDLLNSKVVDVGLEREWITLLYQDESFCISISYGSNNVLISRLVMEEGIYVSEGNPFTFPLTEFDFSNPGRAVSKIKTMLLFS